MIYIHTNQTIDLGVDVYKGFSSNKEDFSRANLKVFFLIGKDRLRDTHICSINENGTIKVQSVAKTPGVYGLRIVWQKDGRKDMYCEQNNVFAVTQHAEEATNPTADTVKLKVSMHTATYGYDGLDAYELSVLRGKTNLSEEDWLNKLNSSIGSNTSVTRTEWVYKLTTSKTEVSPDGETILISKAERTCTEITKVDGYVVKEEPKVEYMTLSVSGTGASIKTIDGKNYVEIAKNTSKKEITYILKGSIGSEVARTVIITQLSSPTVYVLSVKDATPEATSRRFVDMGNGTFEVDCYDNDIDIKLGVIGDVGTITATKVNGDCISDCGIEDNNLGVAVTNNGTMTDRYGVIRLDTSRGKTFYINITQKYDANASDNWVDLDS